MTRRGRKPSEPTKSRPGWAARITASRESEGLSQTEFGEKIGRSQSTVTAYETGGSEPDLATFEAMAAVLRVSAAWLAFGEPQGGDADPGLSVEGGKHHRLFAWTFHQVARLLAEEGLEGDLAYIVAYTRKLVNAAQDGAGDRESKESISRAIEIERSEIRASLDQLRKNLL